MAIRGSGEEGYTTIADSQGKNYLIKDDGESALRVSLHPTAALGYVQARRIAVDIARIGTGGFALSKAAHLSRCMTQSEGNYVEIGTQFGFSAISVAAFVPGHIYCIDPMEKLAEDTEQTNYGNLRDGHRAHVGERLIFERNVKHFGLEDKITLVEEFSDPWPLSPQLTFGVAYIDGDHRYEAVKKDFFNLIPFVTHYIVIDDYLHEDGVTQAVPELAAEQDEFRLVLAMTKMAVFARPGVDPMVGIL